MEARARDTRALCPLLGARVMPERTVKIVNKLGLHARPAAEIVKTASRFKSNITIIRDDLEVNGKSIMGVMMLAAEFGSTILIRAEGEDADAALDALEALVAAKFGES
jgi:phosphocarrier protein HPr